MTTFFQFQLLPILQPVFLLILLFAGTSTPLMANNPEPDCMSKYTSLNKKYTDIIARELPASPGYFRAVHGIEEAIFTAMQSCPQDTYLLALMGEVQISLGNLQLATLYARKAYGQNQGVWQTNHLMGKTLSLQDEHSKSLPYLETAARLSDHKPELVYNLCRTSLDATKYELAVKHCSSLIERDDHKLHAYAYYIRSQAYKALDMDKKSQRDIKNARLLGYE
jgi:hypothetical protein